MIRRSILSHARTTALLMLFVMAAPTPSAQSQDRTMQDRLDRLERDLSMLQRQVYHGSGGTSFVAGSGGAVEAELRMDRIEAQMRELTGRVEDAANGVEQLRRRLEQINSDIDVSGLAKVRGCRRARRRCRVALIALRLPAPPPEPCRREPLRRVRARGRRPHPAARCRRSRWRRRRPCQRWVPAR